VPAWPWRLDQRQAVSLRPSRMSAVEDLIRSTDWACRARARFASRAAGQPSRSSPTAISPSEMAARIFGTSQGRADRAEPPSIDARLRVSMLTFAGTLERAAVR